GACTEVDPVEIEGENLILRQLVFEPEGQQKFLDLTVQSALGAQENVLGQLLADGRASLNDPSRSPVDHSRPNQADGIDPWMAVEATVLDRQHCLRNVGRQVRNRERLSIEFAIGSDAAAVSIHDLQARLPRQLGHPAYVWKVARVPSDDHPDDQDHPDAGCSGPGEQATPAESAGR